MNTKKVGDAICVKDPSGEFYVMGEIGHVMVLPPPIIGMNNVVLYYIISFDESQNQMTDPEVVDFEYYDVLDSNCDLIIDDEEEMNTIAREMGYEI